MVKYYYENLLSNQNVTATTNIVWAADITTLRLFRGQKAFIFLCIDIHTNYIVASLIVQHAAQIIGHSDIHSTMSYQRYALSKRMVS